jgi:integrase
LWVQDLERRGKARGTVQSCYALLSQIMAEAVREDLIGKTPCHGVRFSPDARPARAPRALSSQEAARLLEALVPAGAVAGAERGQVSAASGSHDATAYTLVLEALGAAPAINQPAVGVASGQPVGQHPNPKQTKPSHDAAAYTLVLTMLGTGMRWGEAVGLRRQAVQLLRRPPHLVVADALHEVNGRLYFGPPKTRASQRTIPLPSVVAQALAVHLPANGNPDDLVFTAPQGGPWRRRNWATRCWLPALERAGLEGLRVHDLRHTYASWLADGGIPEVIVAAVMGHKVGPSMTAGYTSVVAGFEDRVLEVLDERLSVAEVGRRVGG